MNELPVGWSETPLDNLLSAIEAGRSFKCSERPAAPEEWGVIKVSAMTWREFDEAENKAVLSEDHADPRFEIRSGDLLFSRANTVTYVGAVVQVGETRPRLLLSDKSLRLVPRRDVSPRWLLYYLRGQRARRYLESMATGTKDSMRNISQASLRNLPVPVAPLREQERITATIDEQFSRLDAGVATLERVGKNLRRLRTAVLQAAATGMLVPAERPTPVRPLGEALSFLDQGWSPRCQNTPAENENHWGVIKTTAVQAMHFDESANKQLPDKLIPRPEYELMPGDLLITRAGPRARAGVCCLVRKVRPRLMICDKVYRFRADVNVALPEYLELVLNAPSITMRIDQLKTGISDSGVNITQQTFRELEIALPALETQERIVAEAEGQLTIIEALEVYLKVAMTRAHQLRSSVLEWAFSGKLVPRDPVNEPASTGLARTAAVPDTSGSWGTVRTRIAQTFPETVKT